MGNITDICRDIRNLTCRPRDNRTFKKELERQCHVQMLILLVAAFIVGYLLMVPIRTINKYWCALGRRITRPISEKRSNRSDHYVTSIIGGIVPPRAVQQRPIPLQREEIWV